ncbi:uracil-DNA glycosylase [Candidatus Parcubacteria bacterium]|nr:uracil-DNA glycosylase [Candidatus Parcubacteria bacterium]
MDVEKIEKELRKIKDEVLRCQKCVLYQTRTYPVIGEGNHQAKIVFIGEAPGESEDKTGRPFCGAAGKVLDELLNSAGIERTDVYICNILKCRPPENRNPKIEEIEACTPYLLKQIEIIKPKVICTLGNFSTAFIFEKYGLKDKIEGISKIHGNVFEAKTLFGSLKIIPLYHPAAATYNPNMKETLKKDFQILKKI